MFLKEACIGFLGYRLFAILPRGIWDTIQLLPGIWDTVFSILFIFMDIGNLGKLIIGIFANL